MEGAPKFEKPANDNEKGVETMEHPDWRILKAEAPEQAKERIAQIEGFESMSTIRKIHALHELDLELAEEKGEKSNDNRFISALIHKLRGELIDALHSKGTYAPRIEKERKTA